MCSTVGLMGTLTVRLDAEDEQLLDELASQYGGRSAAIRAAIRQLSGVEQRRKALIEFVEAWDAEVGPADEAEVARMIEYYNL